MDQLKPDREWLLERYLLGELPPGQRRELERELEDDPALRAELERLRLSNEEILGAYPAGRLLPDILKKAARREKTVTAPSRWRLAWVPALAAAVLLLVFLPPILRQPPGHGPYTGIKGGTAMPTATPGLQIFRSSNGSGEALNSGDQARGGDLLQLAYVPAGQTHGVILSIDGSGSITLHFPEKIGGDTALQNGRRVFLPQSYELDRAPRFERFFFITAREPLPTAAILEKAGELAAHADKAMTGRLDIPGRFRQFSFLVRK
jgi:hypothetical protein